MDITSPVARRALLALALLVTALACVAGPARAADPPDPLARGKHPVTTMSVGSTAGAPGDTSEAKLGLVSLQEPNGSGNGTTGVAAPVDLQVRGSLYYPTDARNAPLIFLVHGNHGSCHQGSAPNCGTFNRNDAGYAYLAENLASWGYVVFSLDQDQMMYYQDSSYGKGMHQRRLLIAAALDGLYAANQPGGLPETVDANVKDSLVGKIDFNRIGMMGHSRGGDAVSNFLAYNRERPAPGRRYKIRAVLALAPVDYERSVPQGLVYAMEAGACDGDVSNTQGTRMFARSLYADASDPFPRIQMILHGANHDAFNTSWDTDSEDASSADPACGPNTAGNIRLSRGAYTWSSPNFFLGDPALMGDQAKAGLATMAAFFRRYVGGELGFDPYMTGEVMSDGKTPGLGQSACPTSATGLAMPCFDRLSTTYFAAPAEREDVIQPDAENPLTVSALGTSLVGSGFADPYANSAGTVAQPATAQGFDWCNPEPNQFTPSQLGISGLPTAKKPCPLPAASALGGQSNGARENAPVNGSYQPQLTLAWEQPATLSTRIPAADGDVSGFKALALDTSVNYWDPRNPTRSTTLPETGMQNFTVTLTDAAGRTATVAVGDKKYGLGLQQSIANITTRMHVILRENRIPIADFTAQGLDATQVRSIAFGFGGAGMPASGSIQLANVRFQEAVGGTKVFADTAGASGPATNPVAIRASNAPVVAALKATKRAKAAGRDVVWVDGIKR
jgi:dienelactone hydrolase